MEFECSICYVSYPVNDGVVYCSPFNEEENTETTHGTCIDCIKGLANAATTEAPIAKGGIGLPCPILECENVLLRSKFHVGITLQ